MTTDDRTIHGLDAMPPEALLDPLPPPLREAGRLLRDAVRQAVPEAVERVRPGWRLIGYDVPLADPPARRGRARRTRYFCFIAPEPIHVHLGFEYGVFMRDPDGLLLGAGITRQVRWLTFHGPEAVRSAELGTLIREAARVALLPAPERRASIGDLP